MPKFEVHAALVALLEEFRADVDRLRRLLRNGSRRALSELDRGCKQAARRWFGSEEYALAVRECVEGDGYVVERKRNEQWPMLGGPTASTAYAYCDPLASWGAATAGKYNAWVRHRARLLGAPRPDSEEWTTFKLD